VSPLPGYLIDRWKDRPEPTPGQSTVYWHVLLGHDPQARAIAQQGQQQLAKFGGLHLTPLQWLHMTVLVAGAASDMPGGALTDMLAIATRSLSGKPPIEICLGKILYHPAAVVLAAHPAEALTALREAAQEATRLVRGNSAAEEFPQPWIPHVTLGYSTMRQPAGPIIAALGKDLPRRTVTIDALSLVIQRGAERDWDWQPLGTARLLGRNRQ
jgi:2'-5' RNA ligase